MRNEKSGGCTFDTGSKHHVTSLLQARYLMGIMYGNDRLNWSGIILFTVLKVPYLKYKTTDNIRKKRKARKEEGMKD